MKKAFLLFLIISLNICIFNANAQTPDGCVPQTTYYPHLPNYPAIVHEQYYVWSSNQSVKQGLYKEYTVKGVVLEEGIFNKGNKTGKWIYHDEYGALTAIENYNQANHWEGEHIVYEIDPKDPTKVVPIIDEFYKDGKKEGESKKWYRSDEGDNLYALKEDDIYHDDTLFTARTYTYANGFLSSVDFRKDSLGLIVVHTLMYYPDGDKRKEFNYGYSSFNPFINNGKLVQGFGTATNWYDTTETIMESNIYSSDGKTSKFKLFNRQGKLTAEGETGLGGDIRDPKFLLQGKRIDYYPSGAKYSEGNYSGGNLIGCETYWNEDGSKKGNSCFNQDGSMIYDTLLYSDGKIRNVNVFQGSPINMTGGYGNYKRIYYRGYQDYNGQQDSLLIDTMWHYQDHVTNLKLKYVTMFMGGKAFYYEGYNLFGNPDSVYQNIINNPKDYLNMFINKAWYENLNKDFSDAITTCQKGLKCDSTNLYLKGNLADAYLLSGNYQSAMALYKRYLGQNIDANLKWEQSIKNDFATYKSRGIQSDSMDKALKELNLQ